MGPLDASGFDATERLATRVLDGEVIFFVGSGFSVDSEGNNASRLVGRLLAALLAMGTVLDGKLGAQRSQGAALLDRLGLVFGIAGAEHAGDAAREPARCMTDANLKLLARDYYSFNDWATSAFGVLSSELIALDQASSAAAARQIQQLATFLLGLVGDTVPLDAVEWLTLAHWDDEAARGKAMFLDALGFANQAIMAGTPLEDSVELVARSYRGRIRPRHHALARLAREGLAPATVTTNYDLLLEGAYRLAGFVERERADAPDSTPSDRLPRFSRIAGAGQFFTRGQGYRTALLLKIHGCAQAYRDARRASIEALAQTGAAATAWADYLPAMVFTYREIQTWRADAWSRDLIRTYLRTHTIALCGYSAADPVMHNTFREVYDEKTVTHGVEPVMMKDRLEGAKHASVFFFGIARRREFHSLEILRAATAAAGFSNRIIEHPNHIEFELDGGFPTVDDHFRLLTHVVIRRLQHDAVRTRLRRLMYRMLGGAPPHDADLVRIEDHFVAMIAEEERLIAATYPPIDPRAAPPGESDRKRQAAQRLRDFDRIVGWTWHFVPGLMRELALADTVEAYRGAGRAVRSTRSATHYHPLTEHPDWAAWTVVVEVGVRRLLAALKGEATLMPTGVLGEESPHAALSFDAGDAWLQPRALCVRLRGFDRPNRTPQLTGAFQRVTYWEMSEDDVPWPLDPKGYCPPPDALWRWAVGTTAPTRAEALRYLGVTP